MSFCKIGQIQRCDDTGCEYSKHFGIHCHGEKIKTAKIPTFEELVMLKQESEKTGLSFDEIYKMSRDQKTFPLPKKKNKQLGITIAKPTTKRRRIYDRSGGICYLCGEPVEFKHMSVDHVIPKSRGGKNNIENLRATHPACNSEKSNKLLHELGL